METSPKSLNANYDLPAMSKVFGDPDAMSELWSNLGWQGLLEVIWPKPLPEEGPTSKSGWVA